MKRPSKVSISFRATPSIKRDLDYLIAKEQKGCAEYISQGDVLCDLIYAARNGLRITKERRWAAAEGCK